MTYPLGQPVRLALDTFSDAARTIPADPTTVTLDILGPDDITATYTLAGGQIIRDAAGVFHCDAVGTTAGHYSYHWETTGTVATALDGTFDIAPAAFYASPADVRNALAGNNSATGTAASLADDDLYSAIWEAQTEVDGRLASRYQTPFLEPPPLVIAITRDIAGYLATLTYRKGAPIPAGDPVLLRYSRAQALLTQAANGNLGFPEAPAETAAGEATVVNPVDGDLWTKDDFHLRTVPSGAWPGSADAPLRW